MLSMLCVSVVVEIIFVVCFEHICFTNFLDLQVSRLLVQWLMCFLVKTLSRTNQFGHQHPSVSSSVYSFDGGNGDLRFRTSISH